MPLIPQHDWVPFTEYKATPGYLVVTPDPDKVRIPFEYKLVKWDGQTLTEECGKTYFWLHNPYKSWRMAS